MDAKAGGSAAMKETRFSVMSDLIRANGWRHGVELGVWQGALLGHLLKTHPDLYLTGVDHWRREGAYASKDMHAAEALARMTADAFPLRAKILKMSTRVAASEFSDGSLDFVFIDASHDTESVLEDIRVWRPKIRRGVKGGALTGHDANWASVEAALDLELPGWKRLGANVWHFPL